MKQMVYVVLDNGEVVGVYDEYTEAEEVATETATITPVIVGQTDDCRVGCETPSEVITAMEHEFQNLYADEPEVGTDYFGVPYDEDDDVWEEEEEEEEEEEPNPFEEMIYDLDGQRVISKEDACEIYRMIQDIVLRDDRIPMEQKLEVSQQIMIDFSHEHGIWGVDMR